MSAIIPPMEKSRLDALQQFKILDTGAEPEFDNLVHLAAHICGTPHAALTFIGDQYQLVKAGYNLPTGVLPHGAIAEALLQQQQLLSEAADGTGEPLALCFALSWYLAIPLRTDEGYVLGALVVLDQAPHTLTDAQIALLRALAAQAVALLTLRWQVFELRAAPPAAHELTLELFQQIIERIPLPILLSCTRDGTVLGANTALGDLFGTQPSALVGLHTPDFYGDPADRLHIMKALRHDGSLLNHEMPIRIPSGEQRWVLASVQTLKLAGEEALLAVLNDVSDRKQIEARLFDSQQLLQLVIDNLPQSICWKDPSSVFLGCNRWFARDLGLADHREIVGRSDYDFTTADLAALYQADDQRVIEQDQPLLNYEEQLQHADGSMRWLRTSKVPLHNIEGAAIGILVIFEDITQLKIEEAERMRMKDELIRAQAAAIEELSTPLIPLNDQAVIMPLIGAIDSRRAQQVLATLLEGVADTRANVAILDITGVQVVDTQVANALVSAAQAARLLGAQVVITGIRPEIAQTLVGLGVDLGGIVTRGSLQSGIAFALARPGASVPVR